MSLMRPAAVISAFVILAAAWLGPLPDLAQGSFSAHMTMHMAVVALAAPLLALGLSGSAVDPARVIPRLFAPIPASIIELVVVWAWHAPALHHAARHQPSALVLEQASFLAVGLLLWIAVLGGDPGQRRERAAAGVVGLLLTSMHMTLLGALFALSPRPLYPHLAGIADQHLGGAIMLLVGGMCYLAGGLWMMAGLLRVELAGRAAQRWTGGKVPDEAVR
jgi:putative membrane protein